MNNLVVHRIVELHAAARGEVIAFNQRGTGITYRELNVRANGVARRLLDMGFRRSSHLSVTMDHGIDLATVLLAALKAGGTYAWHGKGIRQEPNLAVSPALLADANSFRTVDVGSLLHLAPPTSPNLAVLTRPSDLACILGSSDADRVLVPHSTLAALNADVRFAGQDWNGHPSTFDLWAGLIAGKTMSVR